MPDRVIIFSKALTVICILHSYAGVCHTSKPPQFLYNVYVLSLQNAVINNNNTYKKDPLQDYTIFYHMML